MCQQHILKYAWQQDEYQGHFILLKLWHSFFCYKKDLFNYKKT